MNIQLIHRDLINYTPDNIRPITSIAETRVQELAHSIAANLGKGIAGTGLERAVRVYPNGTGYLVEDGQERVEALDALGYTTVPCEVVAPPADIWESTARQMRLHDVDPFDIFALVERAVRLHNTPTVHGTPTTWADVCAIMGKTNAYWSHRQHLLRLIPELREDVLADRIRDDMAAYVGRDLPAHLQEQHRDLILANCKREHDLRRIIEQILALTDVVQDDAAEDDLADLPDELIEDTTTENSEVAWLIKQIKKYAAKLVQHDISDFEDELAAICAMLS